MKDLCFERRRIMTAKLVADPEKSHKACGEWIACSDGSSRTAGQTAIPVRRVLVDRHILGQQLTGSESKVFPFNLESSLRDKTDPLSHEQHEKF